jgi:hypothetical protein
LLDYPILFFFVALAVLWTSVQVGLYWRSKSPLADADREDFTAVQAAALTLLGLIIGFSFSMAISRYDLRKHYEEEEANAIGTEYFRAGLLPAGQALVLRAQLREYLGKRIVFYRMSRGESLTEIDKDTARAQEQMWAVVQANALAAPSQNSALVATGMNDVLNSQGYTQAAWWNRIPITAWAFMIAVGSCCSVMVGRSGKSTGRKPGLYFVLPLLTSVSLFLIADIDSPRGGLIRLQPQNLVSLSQSLQR